MGVPPGVYLRRRQAGLVAERPFAPNSFGGCERRQRESASSERLKSRLTDVPPGVYLR